jgi:hypothetical protein
MTDKTDVELEEGLEEESGEVQDEEEARLQRAYEERKEAMKRQERFLREREEEQKRKKREAAQRRREREREREERERKEAEERAAAAAAEEKRRKAERREWSGRVDEARKRLSDLMHNTIPEAYDRHQTAVLAGEPDEKCRELWQAAKDLEEREKPRLKAEIEILEMEWSKWRGGAVRITQRR